MIYRNDDFIYVSTSGRLFHARYKCGRALEYQECSMTRSFEGYLRVGMNGINNQQHRVIWFIVNGKWPENEIDHINGIRHDNRLCNLRDATDQDNAMNNKEYKNNTSGTVGVCWHKGCGRWTPSISVNGKSIHLGTFTDKEDAIKARKAAEVKYGFHENHGRKQ